MKQLLFLTIITVVSGVAGLFQPFWAVGLYYLFAVLRPQYLWDWALPVEVRWSLAAALALGLGCAINFQHLLRRRNLNPVICLMVVYGLLVMLSILTANNPALAQAWGQEYAKIFLVAGVATFAIDRLWHLRALLVMVPLALGYIAYEINSMYFFQHGRLDIYHYGYGGLDNNGAGLLLAMGVPLAAAILLSPMRPGRRWLRPLAGGLGVLTMHAVLMTYSRGAMLAMGCAMAWMLAQHKPRWQSATAAAALVVLVGVLAGPEIRSRFITTTDFRDDASAQSRFESWAAAWDITWDSPLLGQGVRNSNALTYNYGADKQGRTIHSQYLQIAADSGVPAVTVYVLMLGLAGVSLHRARRHCRTAIIDHPHAQGELDRTANLCLGAQSSLVVFAVGGLFLSLEIFELPWMLMVVAGLMPGMVHQRLARLAEDTSTSPEATPAPPPGITPAPPVRWRDRVGLLDPTPTPNVSQA